MTISDHAQNFVATKTVLASWLISALASFGIVENQVHDVVYAAVAAALSAVIGATIAGIVRVRVTSLQTARSRDEQKEIERENDFKRLHQMYGERVQWKDEQLAEKDEQLAEKDERMKAGDDVRHELISDIGARDMYVSYLEDLLREHRLSFERVKFRNIAEAYKKKPITLIAELST